MRLLHMLLAFSFLLKCFSHSSHFSASGWAIICWERHHVLHWQSRCGPHVLQLGHGQGWSFAHWLSFIFSFESRKHLCMVMEYVEGGDCANLLKNMGPSQLIWQGRVHSHRFQELVSSLKWWKFCIEKGDVFESLNLVAEWSTGCDKLKWTCLVKLSLDKNLSMFRF